MVRNAVAEMRRYYSRKVIDVLIRVTRQSLDVLRKRFSTDDLQSAFEHLHSLSKRTLNLFYYVPEIKTESNSKPVFLLHASLMIPNIAVKPSLEEVQEALVTAGKNITSVAKGVAQWTGGKVIQVTIADDCPSCLCVTCVLHYVLPGRSTSEQLDRHSLFP